MRRYLKFGLSLLSLLAVFAGSTGSAGWISPRRDSPLRFPTSGGSGCSIDETLCLGAGRFLVEAAWKTPEGATLSGHPVSLTSESGYFWFSESGNVDLVVETLDACAIGQGHWLFVSGRTDVAAEIRITDILTGEIRTHSNVLGTAFLPVQGLASSAACPTPTPATGEMVVEPLGHAPRHTRTPGPPIITTTPTPTPTQARRHTPNPTNPPTQTPTSMPTRSGKQTRTPTPTRTLTQTPTQTLTQTQTPTITPTPIGTYTVQSVCSSRRCFFRTCGLGCSFSPNPLHVPVGTTVYWLHATTSDDGLWVGAVTSYKFNQVGTFGYHCASGHFFSTCGVFGSPCRLGGVLHEAGTIIVDP